MSVTDIGIVDGCGLSDDDKELVLLISDHLDWINENEHLSFILDKINSYIDFCENEQYKELYPDCEITYAVIEIHFLYDPTSGAESFLNQVQEQIGQYGFLIKAYVDPE